MQKIIYLDQNIWIDLAKVYLKKDLSKRKQSLVKNIEEKVKSKELLIPSYITHLAETFKIKNLERRIELSGTIGYFSQNNMILPYTDFQYIELKNLMSSTKTKINILTTATKFCGFDNLISSLRIEQKVALQTAFYGSNLFVKLAQVPNICNIVIDGNKEYDEETKNDFELLRNGFLKLPKKR